MVDLDEWRVAAVALHLATLLYYARFLPKRDEFARPALHRFIVGAACRKEVGCPGNHFLNVQVLVVRKLDKERQLIVAARHPGLQVVLAVGGAAEVAGTDVDHAVGQAEALKDTLLYPDHLVVHILRLIRRGECEHLDFGELVDPVEAAAGAAVGARLRAKAVGEACVAQGEVSLLDYLVYMLACERDLCGRDQREVRVFDGVDLGLRTPRDEAGTDEHLVAPGAVAALHLRTAHRPDQRGPLALLAVHGAALPSRRRDGRQVRHQAELEVGEVPQHVHGLAVAGQSIGGGGETAALSKDDRSHACTSLG